MPFSYYQLLGHCVVAADAFDSGSALPQLLSKAGFPKSEGAEASTLAHDGEALVEKKLDAIGEDRIHEHNLHGHVSELEMWLQTTRFVLKEVVEPDELDEVTGADLHADEHTTTAIAQGLRTIAAMRVDPRVAEGFQPRRVRDILTRGQSLLEKVYKATDIRLAPENDNADDPVFDELEAHHETMAQWFTRLARAAAKVPESESEILERLGYVPDGIGIPVGGTSYAVILHERGQTDAPDPSEASRCSGWAIGRQGRNRENLGKGFIVPEFE